ncbi:MAG: type II toxin-antitoxin system VapC family toxin [Desulfobacterales bacterium]
MISVDTNVVVRLLTGDDQAQFKRAKALFAKENIVITTSVVLECEWVLRYAYHFKPFKIADAFQSLFGISNVKLQEQLVIYDAIEWYKKGLDFADAIHLAKSQDSESFATFDKKLIKTASRITRFPVSEP